MPIQSLGDVLGSFIDWARDILGAVQTEVTGSVNSTVQAILDIKEMDCGGNWTVYIKTAIPAAGAAMYLLIIPSFEEILENYLEPKAGRRGGRRGRRGERERRMNRWGARRLFFGGGIPDVDELIANRIFGRGFFKGRQVGPGEWLFWTGINVADSILWQWLVLEATETFFTTWQSGIMESGQCIREGPAYSKISTQPQGGNNASPCWFSILDQPVNIQKNMVNGNNGDVSMYPVGKAAKGVAFLQVTYEIENANPTDTATVIVGFAFYYEHPSTGLVLALEKGDTVYVGPGQTVTHTVDGFASFPLAVSWHMNYRYANPSLVGPVSKSATAQQNINAEAVADV